MGTKPATTQQCPCGRIQKHWKISIFSTSSTQMSFSSTIVTMPRRDGSSTQHSKVFRGLRHREVGTEDHGWSLEPIVRSGRHPVFVQPVKEYAIRRWEFFRSRSHNHSSTPTSAGSNVKRPDYQRTISTISSTSGESIQLNRRTQIMTMIQCSGSSLGMSPDSPSTTFSDIPPCSTITEQPCTSESHDHNSSTHAELELPTTHSRKSRIREKTKDTSYFLLEHQVPQEPEETVDSAQTRNSTSTPGTTVFPPLLIAEAPLDAKKVDSNSSRSSGTPRPANLTFL